MSRVTPSNLAIRDAALAALANPPGDLGLMSTVQVAEAIGLSPHRPDTWRALDALARAGRVERLDLGSRGKTWRRIWRDGEHRDNWLHLEALYEEDAYEMP